MNAFIPIAQLFRLSEALLPRGQGRTYFEYDFERGFILELAREGSCNQCGACCRAQTALEVKMVDRPMELWNADWANGVGTKGVWNIARGDNGWQFASRLVQTVDDSPCPKFEQGGCAIHHVGKPVICQEWPMGPDQARIYAECSYYFRPVHAYLMVDGEIGPEISLEGIV